MYLNMKIQALYMALHCIFVSVCVPLNICCLYEFY